MVTFDIDCVLKLRKFECQKYRSKAVTLITRAGPVLLSDKALEWGVVTNCTLERGNTTCLNEFTGTRKVMASSCAHQENFGLFLLFETHPWAFWLFLPLSMFQSPSDPEYSKHVHIMVPDGA